ncbi:src kinase-associated phosphoprotein 1 [Mantella aurantiaca]
MSSELPRDAVLLLRDAETLLSEILKYENVSIRATELGEEILRGFRLVRKRYHLDFQQKGGDSNAAATGQDSYDDNHSLSYGTSLASDETSLTSDYLDDDSEDAEEPEKVLKKGYLEKRNKDHGLFGSEWRKKWCVLTNMSFCYYSNEKGRVPKGGFLINNCSAKLVSHIRKDSRRDFCFELVSPGNRSYQFTAASPAEARDWVDQIQFLVKEIQSASIPCEDDEESYDDVDSLNSSSMVQRPSLDSANSPMEDDDIYEVVPGDEDEEQDFSNLEGGSIINYADYYQGLWDCTSDKSDELSFQRGDIIRILSKEYNAYGWWVGELHGTVGIVPKDYLQVAYELRNR